MSTCTKINIYTNFENPDVVENTNNLTAPEIDKRILFTEPKSPRNTNLSVEHKRTHSSESKTKLSPLNSTKTDIKPVH